jgi:flavin-binding protein dodecin
MPESRNKARIIVAEGTNLTEGAQTLCRESTLRRMDWFEVVEERGRIADGKVAEFQVTIKIGFKVER